MRLYPNQSPKKKIHNESIIIVKSVVYRNNPRFLGVLPPSAVTTPSCAEVEVPNAGIVCACTSGGASICL